MKKGRNTGSAHVVAIVVGAVLALGAGQALAAQEGKPQTDCPVMGGKVDKSVHVDSQGKRVYFCCAGCIEAFNKDPEGTIRKMEAQGIELEKAPGSQGPSSTGPGSGGSHAADKPHAGQMHGTGMQ